MTFLDVPSEQYHRDELADTPTLSSSVAKLLISKSPAHAFVEHPRLNPNFQRQDDKHEWDIGTAAHALLLEGRSAVSVVVAKDWKTKDAQAMRNEIRAEGRIPLLSKHWGEVEAMVAAAREQLADYPADPPLLADGKAEQTIVWEEDGVKIRARLDWLHDDGTALDDYKTAHDANGENWSKRALFNNGYDVQACLYLRGVRALTGMEPKWRWIVQEKKPPYQLSVVRPGADVLAVGESKVQRAIDLWRDCLRTGTWPGYTRTIHEAELPAWADDAKWLVPEYGAAA